MPKVRRKKPEESIAEKVYNSSIVSCGAKGDEGKQVAGTTVEDMHRIGGSNVENLRLKPREATLNPPGISLLRAPSPREAARQIREAFPAADELHAAAQVIGSTTVEKIRSAGFDIIANPTKRLPHHYRLIHPDGVAGFNDENLVRLSAVFTETSGHAI
jgi:hypothetical protein